MTTGLRRAGSLASFRLSGGFAMAVLLHRGARPRSTVAAGDGRGRDDLRVATPGGGGEVLAAGATDPAFTGGIAGFGRRARSLLPAGWLEALPPGELVVESNRRRWQIARALPGRSLLLLLGTCLGSLLFRWAERTPAEALFGYACWMTLWAFGGLLVLPALSRPGGCRFRGRWWLC